MKIKFYIDGKEVSDQRALARMRSMVVRPTYNNTTKVRTSVKNRTRNMKLGSLFEEELKKKGIQISKVYFPRADK